MARTLPKHAGHVRNVPIPSTLLYYQFMVTARLILILLLASHAAGQGAAAHNAASAPNIREPQLPVIDYDACPGKGNTVPNVEIAKDDRIYSSLDKHKVLTTLKAGENATVLAGANVIRQPVRALIKYVDPDDSLPSLKIGDVVLGYGIRAGGNMVFWAKGVWFEEYYEMVAERGACGFTAGFGLGGCTVDIIDDGVSEWWVQVKTSKGITGWVLAEKVKNNRPWYGNFEDLCRLD